MSDLAIPDLAVWDSETDAARKAAAEEVARRLPDGWSLTGLERCALGAVEHQVAVYERDGLRFALVPGGDIELGWDRAPLQVDDARRDQLSEDLMEFFGVGESFEEFIDDVMTPLRTVSLAPFLIEVEPRMATDYLTGDIYDYEGEGEGDEYSSGVAAVLALEGFRLPTSDEWEHACAAGARTFFRWGDEWPEGEPYGDHTRFTLHQVPNAFGLRIVESSYDVECIAELGFRGGDGGSAVCGGTPSPYVWHTFASAFEHAFEHAEECLPETYESARVRRVFPLP
jgi:hypothetical protein